MPWMIGLNVLLYLLAIYLFFSVGLLWAAICFLVAALLSLVLSGGAVNLLDDLF